MILFTYTTENNQKNSSEVGLETTKARGRRNEKQLLSGHGVFNLLDEWTSRDA